MQYGEMFKTIEGCTKTVYFYFDIFATNESFVYSYDNENYKHIKNPTRNQIIDIIKDKNLFTTRADWAHLIYSYYPFFVTENKEYLEPIIKLGVADVITSHEMHKKRMETVQKSYEDMHSAFERYKKEVKHNRIKDLFKVLLNVLTVIDAMIFVMAGCALDSESNLPFYVALVTGLALVIRLYFAGAFVFGKEI